MGEVSDSKDIIRRKMSINNLNEMDTFFERHKLSMLSQGDTDN